jgi:hypothetical protein
MNPTERTRDFRQIPTDVRFSIRSLLILTVVIAVGATLLASQLHRFDSAQQTRLLAYWMVIVAAASATIFYFARARCRAETSGGGVLFVLVPHSYFLPQAPRAASIIAGTALLVCAAGIWSMESIMAAGAKSTSDWLNATFYANALWGMSSTVGITYIWWGRRIRFCEKGIVIRHLFIPWDEIRLFYWDAVNRNACVLETSPPRHRRVAATVPLGDRAAIELLMNELVAKAI